MKKLNLNLQKIKKEYLSGKSGRTLSKEFNCSETTIQKHLRNMGVMRSWKDATKSRSYRKCTQKNENYFFEINNSEKAYWLGFLMADGCVYKNRLQISLAERDPIDKFLKSIESNQKVGMYTSKEGHTYFSVHITSKKLTEDLINLGCVPKKTHILKFPTLKEEYISHFIRGYFDGDGSIYFNKPIGNYIKPSVSFVGNQEFLESLKFHIQHIPGKKSLAIRHKERNNNIRYFRFEGKNTCKLFKEYLYKEATVFLQRKRDKFEAI